MSATVIHIIFGLVACIAIFFMAYFVITTSSRIDSEWYKRQSKTSLVFELVVILASLYALFLFGHWLGTLIYDELCGDALAFVMFFVWMVGIDMIMAESKSKNKKINELEGQIGNLKKESELLEELKK